MAVELGGAPGVMPISRYDVAVIEPDPRRRMRLGTELSGAAQFESIEELVRHLRPGRTVVAVCGPGLAVPHGFQQVQRALSTHPDLGAVFAVEEMSTAVLQSALRAGARDTVAVQDAAAVGQAVARVGGLLTGNAPRTPAVAERRGAPGRLIAVFSTKGGVGKSTVAINIAVAMARSSQERVVLVDGDLQFGDVAVMLGIPPEHTVMDAAAAAQYGDADMLRDFLARHSSGLFVLPAPTEPVLGPQLPPEEMVALCTALNAFCGYVIVDLPTTFDDYVLAVVDAADEVLLIGSMDIPSIKNLKIGIQALDLAAIAGSKIRLVLNRANTQVNLDVREIEQVLGMRADFPIPSDIAIPMSINAGQPAVDYQPNSPASRSLVRIATAMLDGEVASVTKKSRLGRRVKK